MNDFEFKDIVALISLFFSAVALWFTHKNWVRTNRPIIVVVVESEGGGNVSIPYKITVWNTGNRPALRVKLSLDDGFKWEDALNENMDSSATLLIKTVQAPFSETSEISVLANGEKRSCSFGYSSNEGGVWNYGTEIPIKVQYLDFDGRRYKNRQVLLIKDSISFTGYFWGNSSSE